MGSVYIVCFDGKLYSQEPVIYRAKSKDEDVAQIFVEMLEEIINNIYKTLPWRWSSQIKIGVSSMMQHTARSTSVYLMKTTWETTAIPRGNIVEPKFPPANIQNLAGYDSRLFIQSLGKSEWNIQCIPNYA